ncbi:hypothetical protein SNEBB_001417 [Seison nebaliae]|nr:hypothetical protein SNEBB_001417 [Seison nebaliae]
MMNERSKSIEQDYIDKEVDIQKKCQLKWKRGDQSSQECLNDDEFSDGESDEGWDIPDGGCGWMVTFAAFFVGLIIDGVTFGFGSFLPHFMKEFNITRSKTALIGSTLSAFYLIVGPISNFLMHRYGPRFTTMMGGIITTVAFVLAFFAGSYTELLIYFGIIGGIGFGLAFLCSIMIVGQWFDKKRSLATGITMSGSGLGMFVAPPVINWLMHNYKWRGALLFIAGIILNITMFGAFFRDVRKAEPDEFRSACCKKKENNPEIEEGRAMINDKEEELGIERIRKNTSEAIHPDQYEKLLKEKHQKTEEENVMRIPKRHRRRTIHEDGPALFATNFSNNHQITRSLHNIRERDDEINDEVIGDIPIEKVPRSFIGSLASIPITDDMLHNRHHHHHHYHHHHEHSLNNANNLAIIEESVPDVKELEEMDSIKQLKKRRKRRKRTRREELEKIFLDIFELRLFRSYTFNLINLSGAFSLLALFVPWVYIAQVGEELGVPSDRSWLLTSYLGISNTVGRLFTGLVAVKFDTLKINNIAITFGGLITFAVPHLTSFWMLSVYSWLFGICIGAFLCLRSVLLFEMMGKEAAGKAFGVMILFFGISSMAGTPLAGYLRDSSNSYHYSFYFAATMFILSGVSTYFLRYVRDWEIRTGHQWK